MWREEIHRHLTKGTPEQVGGGFEVALGAPPGFVGALTNEEGKMTERRTTQRFDLSLPLTVRLPFGRSAQTQKGKTRDISTRGVYFVIDQDLEAGSELDITLTLPAEVTRGIEVFVRASGKVIRVERRIEDGDQRMGVAAVIERYDILRGDSSKS
ncbi:MAG: hypothetical protein AUH88_07430 [Acidobacteria bacterium 13_1_40CM_4_61_5]|nr:MAG: hypothetical protein AUH88_07430 [Acidobacteria bacterium 13_1_40CM_4_61_5]PYU08693.1 MAG: hypothetical protein DMG33_00820 [Acidobacteriota bacterium]